MFDSRMLTLDALPFLWPYALCALVAWLVGSLAFGVIVTRLVGLGDIRKTGSGATGATNVLRVGGKVPAAATVLLDSGKGLAAVLIAFKVGGPDFAVIAALFVVLGHMFPVWLGFRGGKGVATSLGVTLALSWQAGLSAVAVWIVAAGLTRISSVGGMAQAVSAPIAIWIFTSDIQYAQVMALVSLLVVIRHHANIRRLLRGQEPRIGR